MKRLPTLAGLGLAAGCASVGDRLENPPLDPTGSTPESPSTFTAGEASNEAPRADWLAQFNDPIMVSLVREALAANPTLASSTANVRAAMAAARATFGRAARPTVDLSGSAGEATTGIAGFTGAGGARTFETTFDVAANFRWELDLWGRLSAQIAAGQADLLASEADLAAAELSIAAQTANAWIDLNSSKSLLRVAVDTVEARQKIVDLTERRFARGLSTALDVRTARSSLAAAEAAVAGQELAAENAVRRLEILLGRYPATEIEGSGEIPDLDPISPAGDPASLLIRRPDVAAEEARVIAAGLRAEEARLALRPTLALTGRANNTQTELSDLFDIDLFFANLIAGVAHPVYRGGALRADRDAAKARAEAALGQYVSSALTAWREVEDALSADVFLADQVDAQVVALEEGLLAEDLALRQYENGLVSIFNLLQSQETRLNSESALIRTRADRAQNRVNYHLALGGGVPPSALGSTDPANGAPTL